MTLGRQVFTLAHELAYGYFHSQHTDVVVSMGLIVPRGQRLGRTIRFTVPMTNNRSHLSPATWLLSTGPSYLRACHPRSEAPAHVGSVLTTSAFTVWM